MIQTTVEVGGMACSMCEAHINDAIRNHFKVKSVSSSHTKKQTEIVSEQALDEAAVRKVIDATGYQVTDIKTVPYEQKKGFLARLFG